MILTHGSLLFKTPETPADAKAAMRSAIGQDAVVASEAFTLKHAVNVGDEVLVPTPAGPASFRLAAVYFDYSNDRGVLMMDRSTFERHFGDARAERADGLPEGSRDAGRSAGTRLLAAIGDSHSVFINTNQSLRAEVLRIFDSTFAITYALELVAIVVAILGISGTLVTLVLEREGEFTILRLIGTGRRQIRRMVVGEAVIIGAVSQAIGLVVGLALSMVLIYVINVQSFGWTIQFHVPWTFLAQSSVLIVAATALAGLYPARRANQLTRFDRVTGVVRVIASLSCRGGRCDACGSGAAVEGRGARPRDRAAGRPRQSSGLQSRVVVLHRQSRLDRCSAVRLSADVLPHRHGSAPTNPSRWAVRDLFMTHLALTDADGKRYRFVDRINRSGPGWAGAATDGYRVWNEGWQASREPGCGASPRCVNEGLRHRSSSRRGPARRAPWRPRLQPQRLGGGKRLLLLLADTNADARHRDDRWARDRGQRSELDGPRVRDDVPRERNRSGWDWFSVQLDDGRDLMVFQLRRRDGSVDPRSSGTLVEPDGAVRHIAFDSGFSLEPGRVWTSSASGGRYPVEWRVRLPRESIDVSVRAVLDDQELRTGQSTGINYWEGAIDVKGRANGRPVQGRGYLEMTGYSGRGLEALR